jgi:hypothetical protein
MDEKGVRPLFKRAPLIASSLQRRQWDKITGRACRFLQICCWLGHRRLETGDACAQLAVFVPKLPVRLSQALEPPGDSSRAQEPADAKKEGGDDEQPLSIQQIPYLSERLATVSTACHNTAGLP